MRKDIENEIVVEFLDIIKNHTISKNNTAAKKKKHPNKAVAGIAGAIIISLTVTIQSDSLKRNQPADTNELHKVKKISNAISWEPDSAGEMPYSTNMALPRYLDEVYSTDAGSEIPVKTKLENL
jgi:hypothetical protein